MVDAILYAAPEYLAKLGHPKTPYDLRHADFINMDRTGGMLITSAKTSVTDKRAAPPKPGMMLINLANAKQPLGEPMLTDSEQDMTPKSENLADFVPYVDVASLDCGHWIQQEMPEETTSLILECLAGQDAG